MKHNRRPQLVPVPHRHSGGREPSGERGGLQQRPLWDTIRTKGGIRETPSCPTPSLSLLSLQEQLATSNLQAGIAEATAWIVTA
jgi:hypothetical protein